MMMLIMWITVVVVVLMVFPVPLPFLLDRITSGGGAIFISSSQDLYPFLLLTIEKWCGCTVLAARRIVAHATITIFPFTITIIIIIIGVTIFSAAIITTTITEKVVQQDRRRLTTTLGRRRHWRRRRWRWRQFLPLFEEQEGRSRSQHIYTFSWTRSSKKKRSEWVRTKLTMSQRELNKNIFLFFQNENEMKVATGM